MSVTALYIFTPTPFTTCNTVTIECLGKDQSSPPRYSVTHQECSGTFTLDPGVYRLSAGVSITPGPDAVEAGGTVKPTGFRFAITNTKTNWPDPPATAGSDALGIPLDALRPFLDDAGEVSVLAPAATSAKQANG